MSIHLSQDERDCLERLASRSSRKPTRRQKAVALLRLAEGLSLEKVAEYAGIRKEEIAALAAKFAAQGLAGVGLGEKPGIEVRRVRTGIDSKVTLWPAGATLADLLRQAGATTTQQLVTVDGVIRPETSPLSDGAVVVINPQSRNAACGEPWRATIPAFRDEALFQEYTDALKARRQAVEPEEDPSA